MPRRRTSSHNRKVLGMLDRDTFSEKERNEVSIVDVLRQLWDRRRLLVVTTLTMTVLAVLVSAVHYWLQPVRWTASLEFRPTFKGAELGQYPNALPFAGS